MNIKSKERIPEELEKLAKNRGLILLVKLMGFLHDMGKLSSKLYKEHYKRWDEEDSKKYPNLNKIFSEKFENLLKGKIETDVLEKVKNCEIKGFQRHHIHRNEKGKPIHTEDWRKNWIEEIINLADNKDSSEDRGKAIHKQEEFISSVFGEERKFFDKELSELDTRRGEFWRKILPSIEKLHSMLQEEKISKNKMFKQLLEINKKIKEK